jgi:Rad3-related DNA helicase
MDLATMPDEDIDVTFGDLDFDTIEAAVMETARGRWFLKEYARRNRHADTQAILAAVERLKQESPDGAPVTHLHEDLKEMASAIRQAKDEVRSLPVIEADDPLSTLSDEEFQAAAEQRIRRMVQTLNYLEGRIHGLMALCEEQPSGHAAPDGATPFEGEKRAHPHPAFLM